jgi:anti-sigma28 factor (negative regulator of flagellin synthesis)
MAIDPTKASGSQPLAGPRLDQTAGNQSARQSGQVRTVSPAADSEGGTTDDRVQLSEQARASRAEASASGLTTDRLQEILKRVTSGYYDSPQVVDRVARRLADELGGASRLE